MDDIKFARFITRDLVYSCVNGQDLLATVLTPKKLQEHPHARCPVLVHWHGGGFVLGHRMYAPWWPTWSLELAILQSAIVISPDYRLLPEANGADILADVEAFWTWMQDDLPSIADQESWNVSPDLNRIACVGESAGGWLAVQSSLLFSSRIEIKAVISISAPLGDSGAIKYSIPGPRVIMGARPPPPRQAELMIKKYIRAIKPGAIRSVGDPAEMWQLLLCIFQQAWLPRLLGVKTNPLLNLTMTLHKSEVTPPPLWIIHAEQDSVVPVECSIEFAKQVQKKHPELPVRLTILPGDHDFSASVGMDTSWVQDGYRFVSKFWP